MGTLHYSIAQRSAQPGTVKSQVTDTKVYANAQMSGSMDLDEFSHHIAQHGSTYSRGTIKGVISDAVECLREALLEGKKVRLGELGCFFVSLRSNGERDPKEFTAKNITAVNTNWEPGKEFVNMIQDAEFEFVPTRAAQEEAKRKERGMESTSTDDGKTNVD